MPTMSQAGNLAILDTRDAGACAKWTALWEDCPDREVFAHPCYAQLFCGAGDLSVCVVWGDGSGKVLFPLILRRLSAEPWTGGDAIDSWDAVTPYGYGGPHVQGEPDADAFWLAFGEWARSRHLASLFVRFSLFPEALLPFQGEVVDIGPNVVRSLAITPAALWRDYEHKVRKNTSRARREGITVEFDPAGSRLDDFLSIYHETLDRRTASTAYYFDRGFFLRLIENLSGRFAFFHALHQGRLVSSELVLESARRIYSFLGGTRADAFDVRPNDLLKHEIILWGIRREKDAFVLGGGYEPGDGIFRYKRSFAPGGVVPFCVGQRILDPSAYERLVSMRAGWEARRGREWRPRPGYFPSYRG
jgi:hypothetical protein